MGSVFDKHIRQFAFRLELVKSANGSENLLWHGMVDGEEKTFDVEQTFFSSGGRGRRKWIRSI
jgi:hypothetical protein